MSEHHDTDSSPGAGGAEAAEAAAAGPGEPGAGGLTAEQGDAAAALAVGGLAFLLYAATAAPTVSFGGDCGELAAAAVTLGVPHPTGYPLWCLLAKLATLLVPFGEPAFRIHLFSAASAAGAVGLVTWLVARLTRDRAAAALAGGALACAVPLWSQAVLAEVYALHAGLVSAILAAHAAWHRSRDARWLNLLGLAYGLSLANHLSTLVLLPASLAALASGAGSARALLRRALRVAACAAPCLLLYLYLPLRAAAQPPVNWLESGSLSAVWGHISGRLYRGNLSAGPVSDMVRYAVNHAVLLALNLRWAALLALVGVAVLARRERALAALLVLAGLGSVAFAAMYRVGDRINYVLPAYVAAAVAAGVGAAWLRERWITRRLQGETLQWHLLFSALAVLLPLLPSPPDGSAPLRVGLDTASLAGNRRAVALADAVAADSPAGATVLAGTDELAFALWYRQIVDGQRRDLRVEALGDPDSERGRARWQTILARDLRQRPVVVTFDDDGLRQAHRLAPGLASQRVLRAGELPAVTLVPAARLEPRTLAGCPAWRLGGAAVASAVTLPTEVAGRWLGLPGLKPTTLGRVTAQWLPAEPAGAEPGAWQAVLLLRHVRLASEAPAAGAPPRVLNDSAGAAVWWRAARAPFAPTADSFRVAEGWAVEDRYALELPERAVPGRWEVRLGLVPAGDEGWRRVQDPERAAELTLRVGEMATWQR